MTGPIKAADGTETAPSITFANALASGFYRSGSNQISYSAVGIEAVRFYSSGAVLFIRNVSMSGNLQVAGSLTAPVINASNFYAVAASLGVLDVSASAVINTLIVEATATIGGDLFVGDDLNVADNAFITNSLFVDGSADIALNLLVGGLIDNPAIPKAMANISSDGSIMKAYNVTAASRLGVGLYTLGLSAAMSDVNFGVVTGVKSSTDNLIANWNPNSASEIGIIVQDGGDVNTDARFTLAVYGSLA